MNSRPAIAAKDRSAVEAPAPKCVVLLHQKMWGWLYEALMARMRRDFGTKFIVLAPGSAVAHLRANVLAPGDDVIDIVALEASMLQEPADAVAAMQLAAQNEQRFGVSYLRDLAQQIRTISVNYFASAPVSRQDGSYIAPWNCTVHQLNQLFAYFDALLRENDVDLVISRPDIGPATLCCVHAASARGIPVTFGKGIRYKDYLGWACGPYAESDYLAAVYSKVPQQEPTPQDQLVPPGGSDLRWSQAGNRYSLRNTLREIAVETIIHANFLYRDLRAGVRPGRRLSYRGALKQLISAHRTGRWIDEKGDKSIDSIVKQPFVLFLLPQEPEFAIQSLCREFPHTFTVVQQLAMCLPPGVRLVIKEHAILTGRRRTFYEDLLRIPNVVLAHRLLSGIELAARAAAVATMSGTTGVEATLLGKQVVIIGRHIEYGFLPNVHRVDSFDNLPAIIREALRPRSEAEIDAVRRAGSTYHAAVAAASFKAPGTPPLNGNRVAITDEEADEALGSLLKNYAFQKVRAGAIAAK